MTTPETPHAPVEPMTCSRWSSADARPYDLHAHHLLCAVCVRGGCDTPPCGRPVIDALLDVLWAYPHVPLRICADLDLARAHYEEVYSDRRGPLPQDFGRRHAAYVARRKDLEVCRLLGIYPNTVLPAFHALSMLFSRLRTLEGMCRSLTADTSVWPECPHADKGYYERIAAEPKASLREQTARGEDLAGRGIWALLRPRTRREMAEAKRASAARIMQEARRLYIRPNHALCILCTRATQEPLIEDNLIELRRKMESEPEIPVTLTEGCCMVCDPCNVYHPGEHLCYSAHPKNVLRDLRMLEVLGLPPGATLPARELYRRIFERIHALKDICGWGDGSNYAPMWAPCGGFQGAALSEAKAEGFLSAR